MLTAKDLHLGERFDDAPLVYPTLLKAALFTVVLACFKILEETELGVGRGNRRFQQGANHARKFAVHRRIGQKVVRTKFDSRQILGPVTGAGNDNPWKTNSYCAIEKKQLFIFAVREPILTNA